MLIFVYTKLPSTSSGNGTTRWLSLPKPHLLRQLPYKFVPTRSATRKRALRERGLRFISSSDAVTAFLFTRLNNTVLLQVQIG
jgi:hypothetical protein